MATVKDLMSQLSEMPEDAEVLLSLDDGDNAPARVLYEASEQVALRDDVEQGEAFVDFAEDFGGDIPEEYVEVVVLWAD